MRKININDLPDKKFGRLTIIEEANRHISVSGRKERYVKCQCDCGNELVIAFIDVRNGHTKSCGCLQVEKAHIVGVWLADKYSIKHGHLLGKKKSATYTSWDAMHQRCTNPNHKAYKNYGGRGIIICERWMGDNGFQNFLFDMGERTRDLSIDRINNDGNYEPSNCRWATRKQQRASQRNPKREVA